MPIPELFTGTHDGEMVRTFLNACKRILHLLASQMRITKPCLPKLACQTLHVLGIIAKVTIRQW